MRYKVMPRLQERARGMFMIVDSEPTVTIVRDADGRERKRIENVRVNEIPSEFEAQMHCAVMNAS